MKKLAKTIAVGVTALLAYSLTSTPLASETGPVQVQTVASATPAWPTKPCRDDDSNSRDCFWDAGKRGNGKGHSYWVDKAGNVTYLDPKLNSPLKRKAWERKNKALKREYWGEVFGHRLCWAKVGDTSYIYCFDGFKETS